MEKQKMLSEYSEVIHRVAKDVLNLVQLEIYHRYNDHYRTFYVEEAEAMNYLKWKLEEMFKESYKIDVY